MACARTDAPVSQHVHVTNSAGSFYAVTGWMPATGLDKVKMVLKRKSVQLAGVSPTFSVRPAMQVAVVRTDNPSDWAVITGSSTYSGAGEDNTGVLDVSADTEDVMFVRFGFTAFLGGTTPTNGQADVEVQTSVVSCGRLVGAWTQELNVYNTTSNAWVAVTGWIPAVEADKVLAAFVLTGVAGDFRCLFGYRSAATNTQLVTTGWTSLEGTTYRTTAGESNTTLLTLPSLAGDMFVQFGVAYSQSSAGLAPPGQATVSVATAVRRT